MLHEGWLVHGEVRLHYLEWPATEPEEADGTDLFLLHGLSSNARYWERFAARFPHRRLVALDQRSHGPSDRPATGYQVEVMAADAARVMRELGLDRPVVVGHSWGCTAALAVAALEPDLVAGLAVVDGPVQPMSERLSWEDAARLMQPPLPRYAAPEDAYEQARAYLGEAWDEDLRPSVDAGLVRDGEAWVLPLSGEVRLEILRHMFEFQPQLLWARLEAPALLALARGDEMMRSWKEQGASAVGRDAPGVDVRWYDSRHDIPQIRPAELAADVERLCLEAGFEWAARRARGLQGDFARRALVDWDARELLAHVASTQSALPTVLRAAAPAPDAAAALPFDSDRWNASQVRRRAEVSVDGLLDEVEAGTRETRAALREVAMEQALHAGPYAGRTVASGMRAMIRHQLGHLEELGAALVPQ